MTGLRTAQRKVRSWRGWRDNRRIFAATSILVFSFLSAIPVAAADNAYPDRLRAGTEEASRGDLSAAMADLKAAVALEPGNPGGWYELGVLYGQLGDFPSAESAFRKSLELKPASAPNSTPESAANSASNVAKTHYRLGLTLIANPQSKLDWPGAMTEFRAALKLRPDYPEALNYLGAGFIAINDPKSAIPELEHAIRLAPSLAAAHFNLAIALEADGRLDEAVKEYQAAIAAKPDNTKDGYAEASSALGKLLFRMGKTAEAETALMQALRLNPDLGDAHYALARIFKSQQRNAEAAVEFAQTKDLAQREPDAIESSRLSNLGLALAAKGDMAGAAAELHKAVRLRPDYGVPHYNLGLVLADSGDMTGAVQQLTLAVSLLPGQARPWFDLGRVLRRQGDHRGALQAVAWADHMAPADSTIGPAIKAELASLRAGDPAAREEETGRNPRPPGFGPPADTAADHFAFASQLAEHGDFAGSGAEFLRCLALQPAQVEARRGLAQAYEHVGDPGRAALEYHKLLLMLPGDPGSQAALVRLERSPAAP